MRVYRIYSVLLMVGIGIMALLVSRTQASVAPGSLVKNTSLSSVYYYSTDGNRYAFPNENIFFSWYDNFDDVQTVTDRVLAEMPLAGNVTYRPGVRLVKLMTNPKVYVVDAGGTLRWVTSESLASALYGSSWSTFVDDLSDAFWPHYTVGADIESKDDFDPGEEQRSARTIAEDKGNSAPQETDNTGIALGDGNRSSSPRVGYVFSCQSTFRGGGAVSNVPWIDYGAALWFPEQKPVVDGSVDWPSASLHVAEDADVRSIVGNGLPFGGRTGIFPIASTDDAYAFDRNPNSIRTQSVTYTLSRIPQIASAPSCVGMGPIGIALDGVAIFNGLDAEGRDAVAHEIQDSCSGHPERTGEYHYHSLSSCFHDEGSGHSELFGYALDGFGIFGQRGQHGETLTNEDLDECHGHTHVVQWDGEDIELYHYHTTQEYPYTLGCFAGEPILQ